MYLFVEKKKPLILFFQPLPTLPPPPPPIINNYYNVQPLLLFGTREYIPQIHQIALTIDMYQEMDGKRYYCHYFSVFFD